MHDFDLSPEHLTDVLQTDGVISQAKVTAISANQFGQEFGFNGILLRLSLEYDRDEPKAPITIVAKFSRDKSLAGKLHNESRFYRELSSEVGIRVPKVYLAEPHMLLLEDLAPLQPGDVAAGCSAAEAVLIVSNLAKLHAFGWANPAFHSMQWLPRWPSNPEQMYDRFQRFFPLFLERFRDHVPTHMVDLTRILIGRLPLVVERLSDAPATLIHVDLHLDNIFVELPDTVVLIDWPSVAIGPAAVDAAHFITTSLKTEVRRECADDIPAQYVAVLKQQGVKDYSAIDLERDMKLAALRCWAGMVTGYAAADPAGLVPRQRELQLIEMERMAIVAQDWQLNEFLLTL